MKVIILITYIYVVLKLIDFTETAPKVIAKIKYLLRNEI